MRWHHSSQDRAPSWSGQVLAGWYRSQSCSWRLLYWTSLSTHHYQCQTGWKVPITCRHREGFWRLWCLQGSQCNLLSVCLDYPPGLWCHLSFHHQYRGYHPIRLPFSGLKLRLDQSGSGRCAKTALVGLISWMSRSFWPECPWQLSWVCCCLWRTGDCWECLRLSWCLFVMILCVLETRHAVKLLLLIISPRCSRSATSLSGRLRWESMFEIQDSQNGTYLSWSCRINRSCSCFGRAGSHLWKCIGLLQGTRCRIFGRIYLIRLLEPCIVVSQV